MLGLEHWGVWLAYVLCLASAALCVGYGLWRWNKDEDALEPADMQWVATERKEEEEAA